MQDLPIRYFDQHEHGDIMSHYTNDVDTLRQLISQSIPQLMVSEIKRENKLIEEINQKKLKNKGNNNYFIMNFYQEESNKINFIITTLKNNYSEENISFIFIVHIKRIMDKKINKEFILFQI
jgi:ABC-type multidrug transport system fused ATPase/permease subunit